MTDPAVEAAMRAMGVRADNRIAQGSAAARVALAPIRELHRPLCACGAKKWAECPTALLCDADDEIKEMAGE